jgi:hypothetical protein
MAGTIGSMTGTIGPLVVERHGRNKTYDGSVLLPQNLPVASMVINLKGGIPKIEGETLLLLLYIYI